MNMSGAVCMRAPPCVVAVTMTITLAFIIAILSPYYPDPHHDNCKYNYRRTTTSSMTTLNSNLARDAVVEITISAFVASPLIICRYYYDHNMTLTINMPVTVTMTMTCCVTHIPMLNIITVIGRSKCGINIMRSDTDTQSFRTQVDGSPIDASEHLPIGI